MDDIFDKYGLNARLRPALLMLLPALLAVAASVPALYSWAEGLVGLAIACGFTLACAHFARVRGRTVQNNLIRDWGGLPTTIWLRHNDSALDEQTTRRYHAFLERRVPNWTAPTPEDENNDPREADSRYSSAVKWLLEQTRDTKEFPLVFKENVSYGFRRNALGIKSYAIAVIAIILAWYGFELAKFGWDLTVISAAEVAVIVFSFTMLLWWGFVVKKTWVRDGADAYATALLATCDRL